jgi:hypothetical protein
LPQHFPPCNHSSSLCYSPSYPHSFSFWSCGGSGLLFFIWFVSLTVNHFFVWNPFLGEFICECVCRVKELVVAISYGFDVECIWSCIETWFWDVLRQRCKGNGEICCRLSWKQWCISFGNDYYVVMLPFVVHWCWRVHNAYVSSWFLPYTLY